MTIGLPPETFRIHPWAQWPCYFSVHLAESEQAMLEAMADCGLDPSPDIIGATVAVESEEDRALLGVVFIPKLKRGITSLVAHELGHAAFRALEYRGQRVMHWKRSTGIVGRLRAGVRRWPDTWSNGNPVEEEYCLVIERLTHDFWHEYYRGGHAEKAG